MDNSRIDDLVATLVDSWNRRDWDSFGACFSAAADYVTGEATRWTGRAGITSGMEELMAAGGTGGTAAIADRTIRRLRPDLAVVHLRWRLVDPATAALGATFSRSGLTVLVMAENEGRWWIESAQSTDAPAASHPSSQTPT